MAARGRTLRRPVLLAAALLACARPDARPWSSPLPRERTEAEAELELGFAVDQEIQATLPLVDDPVVLDTLFDLGQAIVAQTAPQPFVYRFRLVVDPRLNAFAVPGGFVYVHTGTFLAAADPSELAGVLGHEIGHVKGHHVLRLQQQAAMPNLLTSLAGIAASAATGEPGFVVAAQGINVALQLRYTREFEDEADRTGTIFMARAGYDPEGMARFFERLELGRDPEAETPPPYLYSHPDVPDRIASVRRFAEGLRGARPPPALDPARLRGAQARLSLLLAEQRTRWPLASTPAAPEATAPLRAEAEALAARGELAAASARLGRAEALDPADPRLPFRRAELLERQDRLPEAAAAYERAVILDPVTALPFYQLARVYERSGDPVRAVHQLEQAIRRFSPGGDPQRRAQLELLKLTFPVISASGLADGSGARQADTPAGFSRDAFSSRDSRLAWWGLVGPRWTPHLERLVARWSGPSGEAVAETRVERARRNVAVARLEPADGLAARPGRWTVEVLLEGDVVDRRSFEVRP
jgi:predicted Zn-dependent protease